MANLGMGVMIVLLAGNDDSAKAMQDAIGKTIDTVELTDDTLTLRFREGGGIKLRDEGQSCCEARYMRTDDDVNSYVGAKLMGAEVRDAPPIVDPEHDWNVHDVQFLVVHTDNGDLTMSSHNEHNGYYGGFLIRASAIEE